MINETIKAKATYLRVILENGDMYCHLLAKNTVKLSHCHELIAAALEFKSKVAMNSYFDDSECWDDEECFFERYRSHGRNLDLKFIMERIAHLKDTPLHHVPQFFIAEALEEALAPPCQNNDCGDKDANGRFVYDEDGEPVMFVCRSCSQDEDEFNTCTYCGRSILYKASIINRAGECPEHSGESYMDEEEREGWDSLIEYWNK